MQKPMYPCKVIRITQIDHEGTHIACWAVDEAGIDGGISNFIMPFDGIIRKIYKADANEVWIESKEPVEYPDGTIDYMTLMFAHDNDIYDLWVGKEIKAGTVFYQEGTKGKATGNHVHFECGKGKFTGSGWYQDASGAWSIINGKKATDCLWIDDSYTIKDTRGYNFRKVMTTVGTPVARNEEVYQVKVFDTTTVLRGRTAPNGDILGYIKPGIYNILDRKADGDYEWFMVEKNLWFAYNAEWCEYLPKKEDAKVEENASNEKQDAPVQEESPDKSGLNEEKPDSAEELQTTAEQLQKELAEKEEIINNLSAGVTELTNTIIDKDKEISALKEQLAIAPKLIFESTKLDYYAIKLDEKQKLYLG